METWGDDEQERGLNGANHGAKVVVAVVVAAVARVVVIVVEVATVGVVVVVKTKEKGAQVVKVRVGTMVTAALVFAVVATGAVGVVGVEEDYSFLQNLPQILPFLSATLLSESDGSVDVGDRAAKGYKEEDECRSPCSDK